MPSIAYQIEFQGSFVYIANYSAGLTIVDVSLPSQPEIVSTFAFSNWTSIIEVEGMRAYVNVFQDGYHIIDISDPGQPADIGEFSAGSTFTVSDNLAYCIGGGGFAIINVADASNPVTIGSVWGLFNPASLTLSGTTVIAAANGPLHFFDVSNPADPELEFTLSPPEGQFTDVDIEAGFAYVAEGTSGIRIVDWNNPIEPVTLSHTPAMEFCARVKVSNDLLFAMGYTGWRIYDIADRQNPILLAAVQPAIQTGDMALTLEGLVAFVSGADNVLRVWDVSDPAQPQVLGQLAESGYGAQIVLQDTLLYLADGSAGLRVINVADPAHPEQVGSLWEEYLGGAWSVAVQWPIAYVAFDYGLWSVDVQNPFQPLPVEEGMNAFMPEVCVADSHLFVGFDYYGLLIYDIRDPWNPEYVGLYSGDLRVSGLDVLGQHVAVAHVTSLDFYDAAEALPVTDRPSYPWGPDKFELQGNYPNPFNAVTTIAFAVPTPAVVSLRVFDLLGRQTAVLMDHAYVSAGLHQVQFDASQVASGIYLCSLEVGDIRQTRKMIVLK